MKTKLPILLTAILLALSSRSGFADATNDPSAELKALIAQVQTKITDGKDSEIALTPELKQFDVLLAEHRGEKTDDVAQILLMKAKLYIEVFDNPGRGAELVRQLKSDFPDTRQGKAADGILSNLKKQQEAKKVEATLAMGMKFPDFAEQDIEGKPLSIATHKGKVVLIDFWATWCGPCRAELPNVLKTYQKHHAQGFDIIGISLDGDRKALAGFIKRYDVTWPQFFDGKAWDNKLSTKYGIRSIPSTYLLDGEGKIIGKNLRGEALEAAVAKALAKR